MGYKSVLIFLIRYMSGGKDLSSSTSEIISGVQLGVCANFWNFFNGKKMNSAGQNIVFLLTSQIRRKKKESKSFPIVKKKIPRSVLSPIPNLIHLLVLLPNKGDFC